MADTVYNAALPSPGAAGANDGPIGANDPAPGFFMGVGNDTPTFAVMTDTITNIQLGLKADTAYVAPTLYSNDAGNYTADQTSSGGRASWDFYFSINTNANGTGSNTLSAYNYNVAVTDLSNGTTVSYDPLGAGNDDSGFGPLGVTQGDNHNTTPPITAIPLDPSTEWIAQNAENIGFNFLFGSNFNPTDAYQINLQVLNKDGGALIDSDIITVNSPEPGTIGLMFSSLGVLGYFARRRLNS
jgi:hypothetical protein